MFCRVVLCCLGLALSCLALSWHIVSCLVLFCLVSSCFILSCLVLFCLVLSCLVLSWSCLVLSFLVLSCLVLSCTFTYSCLVFFFEKKARKAKATNESQSQTPVLGSWGLECRRMTTPLYICTTLSKSRHFQPYPVQTRQDTIDVDCCVREYKIGGEKKVNERHTSFVLPPYLLTIGYYWLLIIL
jgi:hypothetical protein